MKKSRLSVALFVRSILTAPTSNSTSTPTEDCKCVPGDSCWPSPSDLASLNTTLGGRLLQGVPPASVCYSTHPNYNPAACTYVASHWFSSTFHATDPISIGWPWWANNSCPPIYPNGTSVTGDTTAGSKGCSIGSYPAYAVNATTSDHVVAAVIFAKKWNIRLNVKSTGHSFQGRSTAFGSLSVWTHNIRGIQFTEDFHAASCANATNGTQKAATIAAGERDRDVYEAAASHNAVVVGGSAQDVGIVGWFTGGGHGPLSSTYGMGVDNVLQVKIVTPDGKLCIANACQNSDLFWAIRGGGGGTFGVVTEVTMKAYQSPATTQHTFGIQLVDAKNESAFFDLLAYILGEYPRLKEGGMQGYALLIPPGYIVSAYGGSGGASSWIFEWGFYLYDKPNGTAETLIEPLKQKLDPYNGSTILYTSKVSTSPDFYTAWNATVSDETVATGGEDLGSRLLPADSLTKDPRHLADVLRNITAIGPNGLPPFIQPCLVANSNRAVVDQVSATPAWRDAVLHFIVVEGFNDSDTFTQAQPTINRLTYQRVAALKSLAPESGPYFNEGDAFDPNAAYDFWGKNYPRLRSIKKKNDPNSLLWCQACVGSEDWAPVGSGKLCKVSWATDSYRS